MVKISDLLVVAAGTASLYVMHLSTANEYQIESKQTDIAKHSVSRTDTAPVVAPEGMQAQLLRSAMAIESTGDPAAPVVVTIPRRNKTPSYVATVAGRSTPPVPGDRASLVRELQRELRRIGCYDGPLNESWTLATRTAMKTFTNRINAILPVDKPDQVLLTLVQGYRDRVCDVPCPPGEGPANDGRCLPNVILAHPKSAQQNSATSATAEQPRDMVTSVWSTVTPADPEARDFGRVAPVEPSAAPAAVKVARGHAMARRTSRRRSNFAGGLFGLFGW
jgi:hypothetical protein